ncbi:MAG: NADH:flavin oxidoreductase [Dehalococcoidia bacterium]|nr:NADH:flavin oxidoreductase [Dehalococcoidia bacterium]
MFKVLQPTTIGKLEIRNRFIRSATQDSSADLNGAVTDDSVKMFDELASGGVGLIVTGHAFVSQNGRAGAQQYGIYCDEMVAGLARLSHVAHKHGAKIAAQITHSGLSSAYLAGRGQMALAPSQVEGRPPHRAMAEEEIDGVINDFMAAAARAKEAGFDAVQLHGAHGFLLSQFFSPITNRRQDRWGGTPENRRRLHLEVIHRVRAAVGDDFPILMKFGVMDDQEGGATLEEGIAAIQVMAQAGLDAIEISGGIGAGGQSAIRVVNDDVSEDVYYRERAARAKRAANLTLALVGGIRRLETAEDIVTSGDADLISLSRALIREPGLINRWLSGDQRRARCISCNKCTGAMRRSEVVECGEALRLAEAQRPGPSQVGH